MFKAQIIKTASNFSSLYLGGKNKIVEVAEFDDKKDATKWVRRAMVRHGLKKHSGVVCNIGTGLELELNF